MKTVILSVIVPDWANYIAQDEDGVWYAYENSPTWIDNGAYWKRDKGNIKPLCLSPVESSAKNSLQKV